MKEGKYKVISFIIYDDDVGMRELYIKIIKKFFYSTNDYYQIYEFENCNDEMKRKIEKIEGTRVYLINVDVPGPSAIDFAKSIRFNGDFISPIILLTSENKEKYMEDLSNILYLDFLKLDDNLIRNLSRSLRDAYRIVTRYSVYTFSAFDEIHRIPYHDIYYIQKNLNDDSVTIFTKDDSYLNYITIKKVEKLLMHDPRFFKCHRSCIINLYNVSSYDKKYNTIIFRNGMTTEYISKHKKSALTEKLKDYTND